MHFTEVFIRRPVATTLLTLGLFLAGVFAFPCTLQFDLNRKSRRHRRCDSGELARHDNVWQRCYADPRQRRTAMAISPRSEKLDLRLTPAAKQTLYAAARAARRSVSDFVLESALSRAEETLPDRRLFGLDAEHWEAFMTALDAPPRPLPRVERLFATPSMFEAPDVHP
ncbi:DUF1778 domain-containing protein [uncultured Lamprocystis sp.]|jgi:uncharacterized protein (DUF1778 family)|uniref:type II toxin-antitoxin system TacA family antitoxin n=1 Tax=uncultured Lamprocystis sp. TaxID=543132 RepID=UPI0025F934F2|nr:DUF1778 domain-containing protein [uncultured Lamprocystis sp.]